MVTGAPLNAVAGLAVSECPFAISDRPCFDLARVSIEAEDEEDGLTPLVVDMVLTADFVMEFVVAVVVLLVWGRFNFSSDAVVPTPLAGIARDEVRGGSCRARREDARCSCWSLGLKDMAELRSVSSRDEVSAILK